MIPIHSLRGNVPQEPTEPETLRRIAEIDRKMKRLLKSGYFNKKED